MGCSRFDVHELKQKPLEHQWRASAAHTMKQWHKNVFALPVTMMTPGEFACSE